MLPFIYFKHTKKKRKQQNQESSLKQIQNVHTSAVQINRSFANKATRQPLFCLGDRRRNSAGGLKCLLTQVCSQRLRGDRPSKLYLSSCRVFFFILVFTLGALQSERKIGKLRGNQCFPALVKPSRLATQTSKKDKKRQQRQKK